ncbi:MAG TPA: amidohydrolase family protein [Candidatus Acidoferrales bacterium]|nr:amidohydrolase family protein [Candidatus Acidoferrales bacterium]
MIIDADGHVIEPPAFWDEYFERGSLYERRPRRVRDNNGNTRLMVDGELLPRRYGRWRGSGGGMAPERRREGGWNPSKRLEDMDVEGIDVAVLFPSQLLALPQVLDPALALAMTKAQHRWLADYCKASPARLKGIATLALQDVAGAVKELERCVTRSGFVGAYVPPNLQGRNLDDPAFEPVWEACESLDVPVLVHPGPGLNAAGTERMDNFFYVHSVQFPFENMIALMTMIGGGVFDRHPQLRACYLESGCGWVPYWADRLNDQAALDKYGMKLLPRPLKQKPSDYVRSQCWFSCDPGEEMVPYVLAAVGGERIVFASDYSHFDSKFPQTVAGVRAIAGLSPAAANRIFEGNALSLFGKRLADALPEVTRCGRNTAG